MVSQRQRPLVPMLQFLGGAGTVTGSRFLIETATSNLLVDCGMYQGQRELRKRNWERFPIDPASIDAVVATHAHVDHIGFLPALCRDGFRGPIHCSPGTASLAAIVLPDAAHLQEEEAAYATRMGFSKHQPAKPLYDREDAAQALRQLSVHEYDTRVNVATGMFLTLQPAGHILGSSTALLEISDIRPRRVVFSGDLGRPAHPLLRPPHPIGDADVIIVESTYGDRLHDDTRAVEALRDAIVRTAARGGTVLIPAFAVDRTEVVLFHLRRLMEAGKIPPIPIYVDSPMALTSLTVYRRAVDEGWPELRPELAGDQDVFDAGNVTEIRDVEGSKSLARLSFPSIIVSASGMATGGRVLHHLDRLLPDRRSTVLLVGFQAPGTRGRLLADGAREIKLLGRHVRVRAEVVDLGAFSVHADRSELMAWLRTADGEPDAVYVVHGEPEASAALASEIDAELDWNVVVPDHLERVRLD